MSEKFKNFVAEAEKIMKNDQEDYGVFCLVCSKSIGGVATFADGFGYVIANSLYSIMEQQSELSALIHMAFAAHHNISPQRLATILAVSELAEAMGEGLDDENEEEPPTSSGLH